MEALAGLLSEQAHHYREYAACYIYTFYVHIIHLISPLKTSLIY